MSHNQPLAKPTTAKAPVIHLQVSQNRQLVANPKINDIGKSTAR